MKGTCDWTFLRVFHRWPVDSPHKGSLPRKIFPCHDVIIGVGGFDSIGTCGYQRKLSISWHAYIHIYIIHTWYCEIFSPQIMYIFSENGLSLWCVLTIHVFFFLAYMLISGCQEIGIRGRYYSFNMYSVPVGERRQGARASDSSA